MFCPPGDLQQQNAALKEAKSNYLAPRLSLRASSMPRLSMLA